MNDRDLLYWRTRGADDYHADEEALFSLGKNGKIHANIDNQMSRDLEDNLQQAGEAYLAGWQEQAARRSADRDHRRRHIRCGSACVRAGLRV